MIAKSGAQGEWILAFRDGQTGHPCPAPEAGNVEAGPVCIRPFEAVACEGAIDEFRVEAAEAVMIHARALQAAGPDIGEKDVSFSGQFADNFLPFRRGRIDDD